MKTIELTQGQVALVDDEDYDLLITGPKWSALWSPHRQRFTAARHVRIDGRRTTEYMHKFLTGYAQTDHKDHDTLNNQRVNLRSATNTQNKQNSPKYKNGTSKYKGVSKWGDRKGWKASIAVDKQDVHLGTFLVEEEAAKAYDAAARLYFGEFAFCNFPISALVES